MNLNTPFQTKHWLLFYLLSITTLVTLVALQREARDTLVDNKPVEENCCPEVDIWSSGKLYNLSPAFPYERNRDRAQKIFDAIKSGETTLKNEGEKILQDQSVIYIDEAIVPSDEVPVELFDVWEMGFGEIILREGNLVDKRGLRNPDKQLRFWRGMILAQVLEPTTMVGHRTSDVDTAFKFLAQSESSAELKIFSDVDIDSSFHENVRSELEKMSNGELKAVPLDDQSIALIALENRNPSIEQVVLSMIFIPFDLSATGKSDIARSEGEARKLIDEISAELESGAAFEDLARKWSKGGTAHLGGRMGIVRRGEFIPTFEEIIFNMSPGEISQPIETPSGFYIVRRDDKGITSTLPRASFSQLTLRGQNSHILGDIYASQIQRGEFIMKQPAITLRYLFFPLERAP